jgi:lipoate-protein ligase B
MANDRTLSAQFLGFAQSYDQTLSLMHNLHEHVTLGLLPPQLLLLEHEPVITITRQHQMKSITSSADAISANQIALHVADRGGDATFHGPGQLVGYPIIKIHDIESYIVGLEQALLIALKDLGLNSVHTQNGFRGIWFKEKSDGKISLKKLVAIGVGVKNGVTKHGFAMNIDIDPRPYISHIIPCGLKDRGVSTLKEAFSYESLEMPDYLVMLRTVAERIAKSFSLTLSWPENNCSIPIVQGLSHG